MHLCVWTVQWLGNKLEFVFLHFALCVVVVLVAGYEHVWGNGDGLMQREL